MTNKGMPGWMIPFVFGAIGLAPQLIWAGTITAKNYDAERVALRPAIDTPTHSVAKARCEAFINRQPLSGRWECVHYDKQLEWNSFRRNLFLGIFRPDNDTFHMN